MSRSGLRLILALFCAAGILAAASGTVSAALKFNTKVTISQKYPAFHGKVKSGSEFCRSHRKVILYRVRNGKSDVVVGATRSGKSGNWKVKTSLITAAYYAKAPSKKSTNPPQTCRSAKSHLVAAD